jgi:hypothetical protein
MFYDQPPLEEASCISQKIDMSATGSKALSTYKSIFNFKIVDSGGAQGGESVMNKVLHIILLLHKTT